MPSNSVVINGIAKLSWEVADSKIDRVIALLQEVGCRRAADEDSPGAEAGEADSTIE